MSKYIALCGIDGSGKSTQAELLAKNLRKLGHKVIETREPGSPHINLKVRDLLINKDLKLDQRARELLFEADRAEHTAKIKQWLKEEYWVISDRSFVSGLAYSSCSDIPLQETWKLMHFAIQCWPDMIFCVDLPAQLASDRRNIRSALITYEEAKGISFMESVRQSLLTMCKELDTGISLLPGFPKIPAIILNGQDSIDKIQQNILNTLLKYA